MAVNERLRRAVIRSFHCSKACAPLLFQLSRARERDLFDEICDTSRVLEIQLRVSSQAECELLLCMQWRLVSMIRPRFLFFSLSDANRNYILVGVQQQRANKLGSREQTVEILILEIPARIFTLLVVVIIRWMISIHNELKYKREKYKLIKLSAQKMRRQNILPTV